MPQTSYASQPSLGVPGGKGNAGFDRVATRVNLNASPVPGGIFVKESQGSFNNGADLVGAATDSIAGIVVRSDARPVDGLTGTQTVDTLAIFDCMEKGDVWVRAEQAMNPGDPVYIRMGNGQGGAGATNQQGVVRKDSDTGSCRFSAGSRVVANGASFLGQQMTLIHFDKDVEIGAGVDAVEIPFSHGVIAATTTAFLTKLNSLRHFVVDEVVYDNPTGFAQDPANDWKIEIKSSGGTSEAQWDTTTGQQGTLGADTAVTLLSASLANRTNVPGTRLNLVITKLNAPANLAAGSGFVRGHYV